jgi:alpha-tubulin suppressor-like RCC1 family protein
LYVWGQRSVGNSGNNDGATAVYGSPSQIIDTSKYIDIPDSSSWVCFAIKENYTLWAFGYNYGTLGDGTTIHRSSPVQITSSNWKMVSSSGNTALAIKSDNTLWAWGVNYGGLYGNNSTVVVSSPIQVGTETWRYVNISRNNAGGIKSDGTLWIWGNNSNGEFGNNTRSYSDRASSPVQVIAAGTDWTSVVFGSYGTVYATKANGTIWAWGNSNFGMIGNNTSYINYSSPIQLAGTNWASVSSSNGATTLAVKTDGTLWAWGWNAYGKLGINSNNITLYVSSPVQIGTGTDWKKPCANDYTSAAIKTDGTLWMWGSNYYNQLGNPYAGYEVSSPIQTLANDNLWIDISGNNVVGFYATRTAGYVTTTPLPTTSTTTTTPAPNGYLFGMGRNAYGELGINSTNPQSIPTQELTGSEWAVLPSKEDYGSGYASIGAIKKDGTLWLWGRYFGTTATVHRSSPTQISVGGTWTALSILDVSGCAVKSDGTLWQWGYTVGTGGGGGSPTQIGTDTNWKYVFKNYYVSCAIKQDDTAYFWGQDSSSLGLFGNNSVSTTLVPSPIQTVTGSWKMVVGLSSMYGIKTDGSLWSWGYNIYGELGLNDTINRSSPAQISGSYVYVSTPGSNYAIAVKTDGTLWGWGNSSLIRPPYSGGPYINSYSSPIQLSFGGTTWVKALAAGYQRCLALKSDGTIWSWGQNSYGSSGTSTGLRQPNYVNNYQSIVQAAYGNWTDIYATGGSNFGLNG